MEFNENTEDLNCEIIGEEIKRCTVPKIHFIGKTSEYYFTKHTNHLGNKSTNYEGSLIKVILDVSSFYPSVEINIYRVSTSYNIMCIYFYEIKNN